MQLLLSVSTTNNTLEIEYKFDVKYKRKTVDCADVRNSKRDGKRDRL